MKLDKILIMAALLASGVARAASLENAEGDVRVNQGPGFVAAKGSAQLAPGDKIKVGRKGAARLVYDDKCAEKLPAGSLTTVARHSPCSFIAADLPYTKGEPYVPLAEPGDPWGLGVGALGLGGLAAGLLIATNSSNGSQTVILPVSP
ncbi:MAG: hypothetical protein WA733_24200 [Methylocystis sp.]